MSLERIGFPREIPLPADEGVFARSALVACLTGDECRLADVPDTRYGQAVLDFVTALGYEIDHIDESQVNILGRGYEKPSAPSDVIDCAESSDLAHLFAAFLSGWGLYGVIRSADPRLSMKGLSTAVGALGGSLSGRGDDIAPPWSVKPTQLASTEVRPANPHPSLRSSLAIMFLLGQGMGAIPSTTSGYDSMERAITHYRGELRRSEGRLYIKGGERLTAKRRNIPRSFRHAVPMIIAAAVSSSNPVRFSNVFLNPTRAGTLALLGKAGVDFSVANLGEIDGEIKAEITINPSELAGFEMDNASVRLQFEDLGSLLAGACISNGLSEFSLGHLTSTEQDKMVGLARAISSATGAMMDSSGGSVTIEGKPGNGLEIEHASDVGDYLARMMLAIIFRQNGLLTKESCISELGHDLAKVVLGDLLF